MTTNELAEYFSDREFFTNPDQEVRFVLSPEGVPLEKGTRLEMRGSVVPGVGEAVVAFRPAPMMIKLKAPPMRKFMFSLKFEANPVIEAHTVEEAEAKAYEWMRHRAVVDTCTGDGDEGYVAQEPYFLEEVKE